MAAVRIVGSLSQHVERAVVFSDLSGAILDGLQGRLFSRLRQHHQERQTAQFAAMRANRESRGKYAPFGWESEPQQERVGKWGPSAKLLVPHVDEQAILERIFELISRTQSTSQVATFLNRHGMKSKGKPRYLLGGQPVESRGIWYAATVQSVLEHSTLVDGTYCEVTKEGRRLSYHVVRRSD